ncbi:MAG: signal peptide peptidase SppA [Sedimentisphaerales bacterium]|nr:signal peptide peptidase SppA [Sedimentisphaerales bacterium]
MDFEETQGQDRSYPDPSQSYTPVHMTPGTPPPIPPTKQTFSPQQKKKGSGWRIFWGIVLAFSILANILLFFGIIGILMIFGQTTGEMFVTTHNYTEQIIEEGPASSKIAVIRMQGVIDNLVSDEVRRQLDAAAKDHKVKAVILRAITPGGTVSASDQIHHAITQFRQKTNKPIVAFMQSIATSGGYYTSVACDKIVAEPTVITGSIGVIMSNLVIRDLLENKLGIDPVVIKSGPKKDWPSMFSHMTEEQKQYLMDKLITPAYERFIQLVANGRPQLTMEEIRTLADGSIYGAEEAKAGKLIDQVGYIDQAIGTAKLLAGISQARVVEYQRPFTISSLFGAEAKTPFKLDRDTLHELAVPQLLYLWDATQ